MKIAMQEDAFGLVGFQDFKRYVDALSELIEEYVENQNNYEGYVLTIDET